MFKSLDQTTLYSLCFACKHIRKSACPLLYKHIAVSDRLRKPCDTAAEPLWALLYAFSQKPRTSPKCSIPPIHDAIAQDRSVPEWYPFDALLRLQGKKTVQQMLANQISWLPEQSHWGWIEPAVSENDRGALVGMVVMSTSNLEVLHVDVNKRLMVHRLRNSFALAVASGRLQKLTRLSLQGPRGPRTRGFYERNFIAPAYLDVLSNLKSLTLARFTVVTRFALQDESWFTFNKVCNIVLHEYDLSWTAD